MKIWGLLILFVLIVAAAYWLTREGCCGNPEGFSSTIRPISGVNIITKPVWGSNGASDENGVVRTLGQYYDFYPSEADGTYTNNSYDRVSMQIAPAFAATVQRDTAYQNCKQKKGKCCPCPKDRKVACDY